MDGRRGDGARARSPAADVPAPASGAASACPPPPGARALQAPQDGGRSQDAPTSSPQRQGPFARRSLEPLTPLVDALKGRPRDSSCSVTSGVPRAALQRLTASDPSAGQGPESGGLPERALDGRGHASRIIDDATDERSESGGIPAPSHRLRAQRDRRHRPHHLAQLAHGWVRAQRGPPSRPPGEARRASPQNPPYSPSPLFERLHASPHGHVSDPSCRSRGARRSAASPWTLARQVDRSHWLDGMSPIYSVRRQRTSSLGLCSRRRPSNGRGGLLRL